MKTYLGDSVYVELDGHAIVLTTENGYGPSNTIVLEPEVLLALSDFMRRTREEAQSRPLVANTAHLKREDGVEGDCPACRRRATGFTLNGAFLSCYRCFNALTPGPGRDGHG